VGGDDGGGPGVFDHRPAVDGERARQVLPAERLGKHKTSWQIITVIFSWDY